VSATRSGRHRPPGAPGTRPLGRALRSRAGRGVEGPTALVTDLPAWRRAAAETFGKPAG